MSCYRSSNNKFFNSPSRMADGRLFTELPNCEMNRYIESGNRLKNTHDYRMFLSRNAEKIIQKNQEYVYMKMEWDVVLNLIIEQCFQKTRVKCNQHTCEVVDVDPNGHGQGREYVTDGVNEHLSPIMKPPELEDNACASSFDSFNY